MNFWRWLLFIFSLNASAIEVDAYLKNSGTIAGTPARSEVEFKMAFTLPKGLLLKSIAKKVQKKIEKMVANEKFELATLVDEKYWVDPKFRNFVFVDYYFDTDGLDLFMNQSDYRLRYRWGHLDRYLGYRIMPFMGFFAPIRAEIQHKNTYRYDKRFNVVRVNESRFEFRNESSPFSLDNSAPKAPWDYNEYKNYVISGKFQNYKMIPTFEMLSYLKFKGVKKNQLNIRPRIKVVTKRYRTHLHLKTPWGSGPNPTQAFIISIDESEFQTLEMNDYRTRKEKFLELEIEMERNVTTEMEKMMSINLDVINKELGESEFITAKEYSIKAYKKMQLDLIKLLKEIEKELTADLQIKLLPVDFKYSRFIKAAVKGGK